MSKARDIADLQEKARLVRKGIIEVSHACGRSAHPAPALSCADLVAALFY